MVGIRVALKSDSAALIWVHRQRRKTEMEIEFIAAWLAHCTGLVRMA